MDVTVAPTSDPAQASRRDIGCLAQALDGVARRVGAGQRVSRLDLEALEQTADQAWTAGPAPSARRTAIFQGALAQLTEASHRGAHGAEDTASDVAASMHRLAHQLRHMVVMAHGRAARLRIPPAVAQDIRRLAAKFGRAPTRAT